MSNLAIAEPRQFEGSWELLLPPTGWPIDDEETNVEADWAVLLPPRNLPLEDNETLETNQHRIAMDSLIRTLKQVWVDRNDFFTGGNMFIYFSAAQVRNRTYRGPDFFVVLDVDGSYSRQAWVVWEEQWKYPDVIVELLSPTTKAADLGHKKMLYEQIFKTTDYFVFDPLDADSLRGWHLTAGGVYEELVANEQGRLWSEKLEMWLGVWSGIIEKDFGDWLRFYDTAGQLVPLPEEAAKHEAEVAQQEAKLAQQEARMAQQEARVAQQGAETAEQKAKLAQQEAEIAKQQAAKLAAQLRALGIEPDQITGGPKI